MYREVITNILIPKSKMNVRTISGYLHFFFICMFFFSFVFLKWMRNNVWKLPAEPNNETLLKLHFEISIVFGDLYTFVKNLKPEGRKC